MDMNVKSKEVSNIELDNLDPLSLGSKIVDSSKIALIQDVNVSLDVCIGSANVTVAELFGLRKNSVLKLDAPADAPVDLLLNGKVIARGNLVLIDENFGIQITDILD
jgi:flagellar motor switch protein FliN/FliY